jgi:GrpB-like predicted nucleotidyltransferase (UPF0157 family)
LVEPVTIADYDPQWPILYEEEKERILAVIGHQTDTVEHAGSTAVPGLGAKPIVDIMFGVRQLCDASARVKPLVSIGYEYVPEHEDSMPERRYFRKRHPGACSYHLHMVETGSEFWDRHLLFRDCLLSNPQVADEYCRLKQDMAARYGPDRAGYTDAKTPLIESVVARARIGRGGRS